MKFSEMLAGKSDAELGAMMRDRFTRLMDAHARGITDEHPVSQFNADNKTLRAHRVAVDNENSGLGARNLEPTDQPTGDDPPASSRAPGEPAPPERGGKSLAELHKEFQAADRKLAADHVREEMAIRHRAGAGMDGELLAARARRSDPATVANMAANIPGYGRLK